jgi:hypothetical protein
MLRVTARFEIPLPQIQCIIMEKIYLHVVLVNPRLYMTPAGAAGSFGQPPLAPAPVSAVPPAVVPPPAFEPVRGFYANAALHVSCRAERGTVQHNTLAYTHMLPLLFFSLCVASTQAKPCT